MRVERPKQPEKEAAGSRHELGAARQAVTADVDPIDPPTETLMEEVLRRENLLAALRRVQANKGAPGIDGMTVDEHGNLWATGPGGVLILSPDGKHLGSILTGQATSNATFGEDGTVLYMTADMQLLRIRTATKGLGF